MSQTRSELQLAALDDMRGIRRYFGRRWRNRDDIDDLVQQLFLHLLSYDGPPIANPRGYIYRTAANILKDHYRYCAARKAGDHVPFDADRHSSFDCDASRILEGRQELGAAAAALDLLPERSRTIYLMRRLENRPFRDIAVQFGISVSAVEKHVGRSARHMQSACIHA